MMDAFSYGSAAAELAAFLECPCPAIEGRRKFEEVLFSDTPNTLSPTTWLRRHVAYGKDGVSRGAHSARSDKVVVATQASYTRRGIRPVSVGDWPAPRRAGKPCHTSTGGDRGLSKDTVLSVQIANALEPSQPSVSSKGGRYDKA